MATSAPASARPSANATPRPEEAPVTIATLPSRRKRSRRVMARSVWKDLRPCPAPSRSSPASGPTCRSPSSRPSAASGASTGSSWRPGATTSTSRARSRSPATATSVRELLESPRARLLGDLQPPRRAGGVRPDRRAPRGDPAARGVGRRRPRRRALARRGADEGHRARGGPLRRPGRDGLHRLAGLAHALLVPAQRLRARSSAATSASPRRGGRSSTSSTPRACASRSRCTRRRSPTTS